MSQINPFRGVVVPSFSPQKVQPKKEHDEQERREKHRQHQEDQQEPKPEVGEDGKPHIDLKA